MSQKLELTTAQLEAGVAVMKEALTIGENGTMGDYTDVGLLAHLFQKLEIQVVEVPEPMPLAFPPGVRGTD